MFSGLTYKGTSFFELLQTDRAGLIPDFGDLDWSQVQIPHGTTVMALVYEDGVLMAGDRLATEGYQVATRDIEKVYKIDDSCAMAIAGAAGPAIEMTHMFQLELEHYEKLEGQELHFEGKANRLSFLLRQNLPAAMQGLVVIPIFAGYDPEKGKGRIYKFDVTGGRYGETDYYATGSGGKDARSTLKKIWREAGFTRQLGVEAAVEALVDAADEDRGTGGFDMGRGIYPTCLLMTESGVEAVAEKEILQAYERVIERRRTG